MGMVRVCGCRVGERHGGHQLDVGIPTHWESQTNSGTCRNEQAEQIRQENDSEDSICVLENVRSKPFETHQVQNRSKHTKFDWMFKVKKTTHQNQRAGARTDFGNTFGN